MQQQPGQPQGQAYGQPGYAPPTAAAPTTPGPSGSALLPPKDESESFSTLEEAQKALDKAEGELSVFGPAPEAKKASKAPPPAKTSPSAARPLSEADPRCENACKAFASLERAAKGVCRLTKEDDARCVRARSVVEENRARVAACKCQANGG